MRMGNFIGCYPICLPLFIIYFANKIPDTTKEMFKKENEDKELGLKNNFKESSYQIDHANHKLRAMKAFFKFS